MDEFTFEINTIRKKEHFANKMVIFLFFVLGTSEQSNLDCPPEKIFISEIVFVCKKSFGSGPEEFRTPKEVIDSIYTMAECLETKKRGCVDLTCTEGCSSCKRDPVNIEKGWKNFCDLCKWGGTKETNYFHLKEEGECYKECPPK